MELHYGHSTPQYKCCILDVGEFKRSNYIQAWWPEVEDFGLFNTTTPLSIINYYGILQLIVGLSFERKWLNSNNRKLIISGLLWRPPNILTIFH